MRQAKWLSISLLCLMACSQDADAVSLTSPHPVSAPVTKGAKAAPSVISLLTEIDTQVQQLSKPYLTNHDAILAVENRYLKLISAAEKGRPLANQQTKAQHYQQSIAKIDQTLQQRVEAFDELRDQADHYCFEHYFHNLQDKCSQLHNRFQQFEQQISTLDAMIEVLAERHQEFLILATGASE